MTNDTDYIDSAIAAKPSIAARYNDLQAERASLARKVDAADDAETREVALDAA